MRTGPQIGRWMCALGLSAALAPMCVAEQRPAKSPPPAHAQPRAGAAGRQPNQPRNERPPNAGGRGAATRGGVNPNANPNRPPNASGNRPPYATQPGTQPQQRFRNLPPQEKQRVLQNNQRMKQLPPAQQQELRDRARVWQQMTPQQRDHIKNDVLPKWNQMSPQRQRAISNRLGVLKNMPESARNQHLADPNFTRGMSEEDKQTLRDLSHMHVGGAPEAPAQSAPAPPEM